MPLPIAGSFENPETPATRETKDAKADAKLPQKRFSGGRSAPSKRGLSLDKTDKRHSVVKIISNRQSASKLLENFVDEEEAGVTMPARVQDEPGFILHSWEWSETSQLLDVLSLHYGRVFIVAKGAKRPSSRVKGVLTGFCPLLFSWSGKREGKNLTKVEWLGSLMPLTGESLMSGFYVNELIIKFCAREEVHSGLFADYVSVMDALSSGEKEGIQPALRHFEKRILTLAGWEPGTKEYPAAEHYVVSEGILRGVSEKSEVAEGTTRYSRAAVKALIEEDFQAKSTQRELRDMLRELIQCHLGDRMINTRRILAELKQLSRG